MYFDLLFLASSLNYYFLYQWCHSNFQTQAKKQLIPHLWSGAIPGGFLQLLNKHPLNQYLQNFPSPGEVIATEQMLLISINNSGAP